MLTLKSQNLEEILATIHDLTIHQTLLIFTFHSWIINNEQWKQPRTTSAQRESSKPPNVETSSYKYL